MRIRNMIFTALLGSAVLAPGASAQTGNQSDVTGAIVTTFLGTLNVPSGTSTSFSPAQTAAVQAAVAEVGLSLANNAVVGPGGQTFTMTAEVSAALTSIMTTAAPTAAQIATLSNALSAMLDAATGGSVEDQPGFGAGSSAPWALAGMGTGSAVDNDVAELVAALNGLMAAFAGMDAGDIEIRPTERLIHAVDEFNEFVNAASEESLRNPPPVFLAIHAILTSMVKAATVTDDVGVEINDIGEVEGQEDE